MKRIPARATIREQHICCGKCRACSNGYASHGPYWYAEWRGTDRKTVTRYIGVVLPKPLEPMQHARAVERGQRWIEY